jgi:hypothetical protein
MYLPKTWGNTRALHRTLVLGGALGCACTTIQGREETHTISAHWASSACKPMATSAAQFQFDLEALGDFPPSIDTHESLNREQPLVVPSSTRAASLSASDGFSSYIGLGVASTDSDIDVSLWPDTGFCELPLARGDCDYLGGGTGYAMGVAADGRSLLVAGGDARREGDDARTRAVAGSAAFVDLTTGRATCLSGSDGLQVGRAGATVTALGDEFLVAGGVDPTEQNGVISSAELFDPATRSFAADPIALVPRGRARHGAVALASNEVLLVGGIDSNGPISERTLDAIVAESPNHRRGLAELPAPRVDPTVVRLSDDRILVTGGRDGTDPGDALQDLLWLDATARSIENELDALACPGDQGGTTPTATVDSAFASMPGGAVLAVGGCTVSRDGSALPCDEPCPNGDGCLSSEVFWIDRDGNVTCCGSGRATCSGLTPIDGAPPGLKDPRLVPGEDGRPWLVEGVVGARTLRHFDPWSGQFPASGIATEAKFSAPQRADAGLFLSIDDCSMNDPQTCSASLQGFRFGVRNPYTQAIAPLLLADTEGVATDRALSPPPAADAVAARPFRDPTHGDLVLTAGSRLALTDTTYDDVDLVIPVRSGAPPLVYLGTEMYGGKPRPWGLQSPQAPFDAELLRKGSTVTLTIKGNTIVYDGPTGRVSIAVGADAPLSFRSVTVTRVAE